MVISSVILALGRQGQEVRGSRPARLHSKFKTSLGYIARPCLLKNQTNNNKIFF